MDNQKNIKKGWSLISEVLSLAGVEYIFGLPGESISPVQRAAQEASVEIITTRHEQAATFMAEAYARMTGKPGVALVTFGPGFTNTISAMVNAQLSNAPVILIAGCHGAKSPERLGLQDMRQGPIIESIVKKSLVCKKAERLPEYFDMAFRIALSGRPGPVFLELPVDVLEADVHVDQAPVIQTRPCSRPVDEKDAQALTELIAASRKPVILAGSGAYYSQAGTALARFVDQTGIPVLTSKMGRGTISDEHPLCFGSSVPTVPGCAGMAMTEADLIILLGNRLCLFNGNGAFFNPDGKIVQVDIEPEEIGRNRSIDLPIFGDVKAFLEKCSCILSEKAETEILKDQFSPWTDALKHAHDQLKSAGSFVDMADNSPIHPGYLAHIVNSHMNREDDIVIADGGDAQTWMTTTRTCIGAMNIIDSGLFGCLGVGLPYGVSAKLINPDRRVLVYTGDGSLGFNFMEIETSIRKKTPLVIVVENNKKWGMTSNSMKNKFDGHIPGTVDIGDVPYHKAVEALGGRGVLVENARDIEAALDDAFASGVTTCINVMTDPEVIGPGSQALAFIDSI